MDSNDDKDLIITALRQRVAALVSNYEYEIAVIRAEYTKLQQICNTLNQELASKQNSKPSTPTVDDLIKEAEESK
jgi:hypothetical protein